MPGCSLRVAVIGAGPAGLMAARELLREGHTPIVFERRAMVGGTWVYDAAAQPDDPPGSHTSLYASLRINSPREAMGFLDFPFAANSGTDTRTFPGHEEVLRYLHEFARRFDLYRLVRLQSEVIGVSREGSARWKVRYSTTQLSSGNQEPEKKEELFNAVVVCNGHHTKPRMADIAGIDAWPGKQMHCHSYRVPDPFQGQVVVIIGVGPSGADISRDIAGVAKEVHVANRSAPAGTRERHAVHANLWFHSMIKSAHEDGSVLFENGCLIKADVIMHCTGYSYSFPFLGADATISVDDNWVGPLYKHVFPPQVAPELSFIGLTQKVLHLPLIHLQSSWVAGILSGRIQLPSEEEMTQVVSAEYSETEASGLPRRNTLTLENYKHFEYEDWLAHQSGLEPFADWRKAMFTAAFKGTLDRPDNYRDEWSYYDLIAEANKEFAKYAK